MEKEFVPYELALRMKQLGFNKPCFKGYTEEYKTLIAFSNTHTNTSVRNTLPTKPFTAPLYQQAFRWFESKGYRNYVASNQFGGKVNYWFSITPPEELTYSDNKGRNTKEEAELACLKKLIEISKKV